MSATRWHGPVEEMLIQLEAARLSQEPPPSWRSIADAIGVREERVIRDWQSGQWKPYAHNVVKILELVGRPLPFDEVVRLSDRHRFMAKTAVVENGCWQWTDALQRDGYGRFRAAATGQTGPAHRYSYEVHVGPIPEGLELDHLCRNRGCVNPGHLEAVTAQVNNLRGLSPASRAAARTHCLNGHPFSGPNLTFEPYGKNGGVRRVCRACRNAKQNRVRAKRKMLYGHR